MEFITVEQFEQEIGGMQEVDSLDIPEGQSVAEPETSYLDKAKELGGKALDYISQPHEGPELNTYQALKENYRPYVEENFQEDTKQLSQEPSLDENYIQALTQQMMDSKKLQPGDSVQVLRELKRRTGKPIGARESLLVRRYLKNPNKWSGISPAEAALGGMAKTGAGAMRTTAGMAEGAGDLASMLGADETGEALTNWGRDKAALADTYLDIQKENTGDYITGEAGALLPLAAVGGVPSTMATTYGYSRGQGMDKGQSAAAGAVDAALVGLFNKLLQGKKFVTAKDLREKGLKSLDRKALTTDTRDLIQRIEDTTGKSVDDIIKSTADMMETMNKEALTEDQVVRLATQSITGGETGSPRAGRYLMGAESLDSTTAPVVMKEAQARTQDVREAVSKNPALAELFDSFTERVGNFEATDWQGLRKAMRDMGLPEEGPLMNRLRKYEAVDDIAQLRAMQRANPVSTKNVSRVGQRTSWEEQGKAELYDKLRSYIYSKIPGINKDPKIEQAIIRSLKDPELTPKRLSQELRTAGIPQRVVQEVEQGVAHLFPDRNPEQVAEDIGQEVLPTAEVPVKDTMRSMTGNRSYWKDAPIGDTGFTGDDLTAYIARQNDLPLDEAEELSERLLGEAFEQVGDDLTPDYLINKDKLFDVLRKSGYGDEGTFNDFFNLDTAKSQIEQATK